MRTYIRGDLVAERVLGVIRARGYKYRTGLEALSIDARKDAAQALIAGDARRKSIDLFVGNEGYSAIVRTTPKMDVVYISSRLKDRMGKRSDLAAVLMDHQFSKNQQVVLEIEGGRVRLLPAPTQS